MPDCRLARHSSADAVTPIDASANAGNGQTVDMPITQEINAVLFQGKSCRKAVSDLMEREAKPEKNG